MMLDMTEFNSLSSEEKDVLIIALFEQVQSLVREVSALKSEIKELKAKKSKNSRNSSKPPQAMATTNHTPRVSERKVSAHPEANPDTKAVR